ncbi:MAG: hypothetical protein JEY94_10700 [Melioribacteraceae bacterium]|nr:hypothetical protein [Melioribacteraceae bacterium]
MFRNNAENEVFLKSANFLRFLVYLFIPLLLSSCLASIKVTKEFSTSNPDNYTISSERFLIKEPIPFDLSEISLKFIFIDKGDVKKYLFNLYYFGSKREDITRIELKIDDKNYEYISQIPVKLEEHGMLGFSEQIYIELPVGTFNKIIKSDKCSINVIGKHNNFIKKFDAVFKKKLKQFVEITSG